MMSHIELLAQICPSVIAMPACNLRAAAGEGTFQDAHLFLRTLTLSAASLAAFISSMRACSAAVTSALQQPSHCICVRHCK